MKGVVALLILVLTANFGSLARAAVFDHEPELKRLVYDLEQANRVTMAVRVDNAIDAMVKVAVKRLHIQHKHELARNIERDWEDKFQGMVVGIVTGQEDLGDHAAWNGWIQVLYLLLLDNFGPSVMSLLHLDDLYIVVMATPVVLHFDIITDPETIDQEEYGKHWEPLGGVLAYWGVYIACTGATWGTGAWVLCTPAGMAGEYVTYNYIAPRFTPSLWGRFYNG